MSYIERKHFNFIPMKIELIRHFAAKVPDREPRSQPIKELTTPQILVSTEWR